MSEHPQNPTLLVGVGAFGRGVLEELGVGTEEPSLLANGFALDRSARPDARQPGPVQNLETIAVAVGAGDDAPFESLHVGDNPSDATARILAEASTRTRWLLDLAHYLETTAPEDSRGPRLDVFLIADLTEPYIAPLIPMLSEMLAVILREEYRPILRAGHGSLSVCPLLAIPRSPDTRSVKAALRTINDQCTDEDSSRRPHARVYIVEDQSGKYVLSRAELRRTFAAFLHLVLFSGLRDEPSVRTLVEADDDREGPFSTFGCATLEVDVPALQRLCATRLARDVLKVFQEGGDPVLTEVAGEAHPLVPDPLSIEETLSREGAEGSLEDYLQPPALPVPDIGWADSPEDIVEHKFGALWQARIGRKIESYRDEVERFNMDRLAEVIERNGTGLAARLETDVLERVREEARSGVRGHARALEFVRYAATAAAGRSDDAHARITTPRLPTFPAPPLHAGVEKIREAAFARPRRAPFRMRLFGGLAAVLSTILLTGALAAALRMLGWDAWGAWPALALAGAFSASWILYALYRHYRRHHNWVLEGRNRLDQALKRYMRTEVVDYFRRRLEYSRQLWSHRLYERLQQTLDRLVSQLEATRAALQETDRELAALEKRLTEELTTSVRGGILFRGLLTPQTLDDCYAAVRPPDLRALAESVLAEALEDPDTDVLEAPFADPDRLLEACQAHVGILGTRSPFGATGVLGDAVRDGASTFLRSLAMKLAAPLELVETRLEDAPKPARLAVVPPEAAELVRDVLAKEGLDRGWDVRGRSGDTCRIHLVLSRSSLSLGALAITADLAEDARK